MLAALALCLRSWFVTAAAGLTWLGLEASAVAQVEPHAGTPEEAVATPPPALEAAPVSPDAIAECLTEHAAGQEARMQQRLVLAGEMFTLCSDAKCPELVRSDCIPWLAEVQTQLPRVTFELEPGVNREAVSAFVDSRPLALVFGEAQAFDPGTHDFRFELDGRPSATQHVVLLAGEQPQLIRIEFAKVTAPKLTQPVRRARPPLRDQARARVPTLTWVLASVGAAGFGVATYFGLSSLDQRARLRHQCAPLCSSAQVQGLQQSALLADVGLGVGVAGVGLATAIYLMQEPRPLQLYVGPSSVALALEDRF